MKRRVIVSDQNDQNNEQRACAKCGAELPKASAGDFTTGYAVLKENGAEVRVCYSCATAIERAWAHEHGELFAYAKQDETPRRVWDPRARKYQTWYAITAITSWPGNVLSDHVDVIGPAISNFGDLRVYFRFDLDGEAWYGTAYQSAGDYVRAKRCKHQTTSAENGRQN